MEGLLAPGQNITQKGCGNHQEEDDTAQDPQNFARGLMRTVIDAAEHMDVYGEEEHRHAIGMGIADQVTIRHVTHNAFDRIKGIIDMRGIVHGEDDAGHDLNPEAQT